MNTKTKKVNGVDLPASSFAFVGDPENTATWKLLIHVPGDTAKTINAVKDSLGRFDQTKGIASQQRDEVRLLIIGAALAHGLRVDRPALTKPAEVPAQAAEPPAKPEKLLKPDKRTEQILAEADRRATAFLKSIGYE